MKFHDFKTRSMHLSRLHIINFIGRIQIYALKLYKRNILKVLTSSR